MALPTSFQTAIVSQITENLWSLLQSMHTWFQSNPTANVTQATNYLNGLAEPYPSNITRIADRAGAFNAIANLIHPYEGKANAYLSLRQFMLDHPLAALQSVDPDLGRTAATRAELLAKRMTADPAGGWSRDGVTNVTRTEMRDPAKGNYVVQEDLSATVGGASVTIRRTFTVTLTNGAWTSVPSAWAVV